MAIISPYDHPPIYQTTSFTIRLVQESDAESLLKCYSDSSAVKFMNSDRCDSDFYYVTLEEMRNCILYWIGFYQRRGFFRFSIIDKRIAEAIGTIEIFGGDFGVLRIDLHRSYEKQSYIKEILEISNKNFYKAFSTNCIITKAIPEATERITALVSMGFSKLEDNTLIPYGNYYIKNKMQVKI